MRDPLPTLLLVSCALAACVTTSTREVSSTPTPRVRYGTRARTWEVLSGGERLGLVVLFEESRGRAGDCVYMVRNEWHQDLGMIDGLGRAYRYLPHREEPSWVGSGTIAAGAQRIIGADAQCELVELDELDDAASGPRSASASAVAPATAGALSEGAARGSGAPAPDVGLPQSR